MRKAIALAVSLALLALIYWQVDAGAVLAAAAASDPLWLAISLAVVVPLLVMTAWRFQILMPRAGRLGLWECVRLTLMASTLNLVLPSKMGDIAKAYALRERSEIGGSLAVSLVVLEKALDMGGLLACGAVALLLLPQAPLWATPMAGLLALGFLAIAVMIGSPHLVRLLLATLRRVVPDGFARRIDALQAAWEELLRYVWRRPSRALTVSAASILLWLVHLTQIWLFTVALTSGVAAAPAPVVAMALAPLAILIGLAPFTVAGVGTRDAALIVLFAPYLDAPTAAVLGILCTLRYLIPGLAGLPLLGAYVETLRRARADG
jgi:uncharacterized protein (TIRG00374 family)